MPQPLDVMVLTDPSAVIELLAWVLAVRSGLPLEAWPQVDPETQHGYRDEARMALRLATAYGIVKPKVKPKAER